MKNLRLAGTKMISFLPLGIPTSPQRCTARVQPPQPTSLSNNYLDFLAAPTSAPWSLVDLRSQLLILLRSGFGRHNSRIACGEFRQVPSAASMFSTSIRRDLGGSRRTATAFHPLVYIARQEADCIYFSSTHRVCAARGDGLPLESMSARMEAM